MVMLGWNYCVHLLPLFVKILMGMFPLFSVPYSSLVQQRVKIETQDRVTGKFRRALISRFQFQWNEAVLNTNKMIFGFMELRSHVWWN